MKAPAAREKKLPAGIDPAKMPRHIAVIMDGNGRWAKKRHLPRVAGHKVGVDSVREIVRACSDFGVEVLTLYAFSTENWLRPLMEVGQLMKLLFWTLRSDTDELRKNGVRLMISGRMEGLPKPVRDEITSSIRTLSGGNGLILNLALNYGGRQEILDAVNKITEKGVTSVDEKTFSKFLYTSPLPDPDLVIRTSGEMRLSNFLLWQCAYSEFYVTPVFWPDFRTEQLAEAIREYQTRQRRFGKIS